MSGTSALYSMISEDTIQARLQNASSDNSVKNPPILRIMTLNIAHGSKSGYNHIFLSTADIKSNLHDIAALISRENPDLVALQEADGPSLWSGNFSHVNYLATQANYPYAVRGEHVKGLRLSYGTAFLSKMLIEHPVSHTFRPSPPTFTKGFVKGTVDWPGHPDRKIDVVSLHLDFARKSIRKRQIDELLRECSNRRNPLIIMGDFNSGWGIQSPMSILAANFNLTLYKPDENKIPTFPLTNKRIDWILISREMDFLSYQVLADPVSDHKGVLAELTWRAE